MTAKDNKSQYPSTIYRVSLKAVIRNEKNEVLVVKEYDHTTWSLPGGGWDHGETEQEALARELKEEVNYEGNFSAKPIATCVFWAEKAQSWLLWIVYDVNVENYNFGVGEYSNEVAFIDPMSISGDSKSPTELWIRNHL